MAEGDHRHCKVCGKVVQPTQEFCSKACRAKREAQLQTRRNYQYILYATIVILVVIFAISFIRV
jgi:predicted nucleic acid-binding Zn ribbon protein